MYWKDRMQAAMNKVTAKSTKAIERQLRKYHLRAMRNVISNFEATYDKLLATVESGRQPTPADLYKLDKYWAMQGQLKRELQKLGDKEAKLLSEAFERNFFEVYYALDIPKHSTFSTIDKAGAIQLINSIWCADGKSWSQRIWDNTELLSATLNDTLLDCVIAGRKTTDLKNLLQERFDVSYSRADALVRTELAHIQTEAANRRYEDYGVQQVEIWADEDERRCEVCGKLHMTKYNVGAHVPIPAHPRCRCCIVPVVDDEE